MAPALFSSRSFTPSPQVLEVFRDGLGFGGQKALPPPRSGFDGEVLSIVLGVVLSVVMVLAVVLAAYFVLRRRNRSLLGQPRVPQPCDETTLAVRRHVVMRGLARTRLRVGRRCGQWAGTVRTQRGRSVGTVRAQCGH
eukprot:352483-Chlamydomonas_euryale.AAC.1